MLYAAAEGVSRVRGLDGNHVYNQAFKVWRGVLQDGILSPIFFILLALEQLFRIHDPTSTGVKLGNYIQLGTLSYSDDITILSSSVDMLSDRVSHITGGSTKDADMVYRVKSARGDYHDPRWQLFLFGYTRALPRGGNSPYIGELCASEK